MSILDFYTINSKELIVNLKNSTKLVNLQSYYQYTIFFNYFFLKRLLSNKEKTIINYTINRFNYVINYYFNYFLIFNYNY